MLPPYFSSNQDKIAFNQDNGKSPSTWTFKVQEKWGSLSTPSTSSESVVNEYPESTEILGLIGSSFPHGTQKTKIQEIKPKPAKSKICLISERILKK